MSLLLDHFIDPPDPPVTPPLTTPLTTPFLPTTLGPPTNPPPTNSSWSPDFPDPEKCNYYILNHNTTEYFQFSNPYGGIPQNLLINFIGWLVLVLLFGVLRRVAGNYGRLAVIRKEDDESRWTQVFFSTTDDEDPLENNVEQGMESETDSVNSVTDWGEVDRGICSWVSSIFTITDDMILRKCGSDALQYIKFQRHLIIFAFIIALVCMTIILPINFTMGNIQGDETNFGHTTISNLAATDSVLWVHIIVGIMFMPLGIYIMRRFSVSLKIEGDECISSRTLMVDLIPEQYCKKDLIIRHLQEAYPSAQYPDSDIEEVQIAYFVAELTALATKLETASRAVQYCENHLSKTGERLQINPHACGLLCGLCTCGRSSKIDALDFYMRKERDLKDRVEEEQSSLHTKSIGVAFITFSSLGMAETVKKDHKKFLCVRATPPSSSLQGQLRPDKWEIRFAPPPEDIYWENLNRSNYRLFKVWLSNAILFIVLFFFTSPAYVISMLETIPFLNAKSIRDDLKVTLPSYITDFLPTLLLWTLSAVLPVFVAYSDWWLGHWRRSLENLWIMRKVFGYLLFMVLILPSIGLTTVRALVENVIKSKNSDGAAINWQCIFLPDNGAFFINYVTTSALVGTGLEIMRFPELLVYSFRLAFVRSQAEISSVRKEILYEFPFGINYAWMLLIFALTVSYSVICPLITPFGLFYIIMKHGTDRYNIYFAYKRSKINKNIHGCAINCVIISLLIQQLILLFFNTVRAKEEGLLPPRGIFSITMFTIFTLLFMFQIFFHSFKGISPIQYIQRSQQSLLGENGVAPPPRAPSRAESRRNRQFIPDVLRHVDVQA